MTKHGHFAEIARRRRFCQGVFTHEEPEPKFELAILTPKSRQGIALDAMTTYPWRCMGKVPVPVNLAALLVRAQFDQ
jgi:hypothetical protein